MLAALLLQKLNIWVLTISVSSLFGSTSPIHHYQPLDCYRLCISSHLASAPPMLRTGCRSNIPVIRQTIYEAETQFWNHIALKKPPICNQVAYSRNGTCDACHARSRNPTSRHLTLTFAFRCWMAWVFLSLLTSSHENKNQRTSTFLRHAKVDAVQLLLTNPILAYIPLTILPHQFTDSPYILYTILYIYLLIDHQ